MPLPDLTTLTPDEQQTLLVQLLRLVAATSGHEAIRQALLTSFYPTPEAATPEWLQTTVGPEEPTETDCAEADAYLAQVRQRLEAKYGSADVPE